MNTDRAAQAAHQAEEGRAVGAQLVAQGREGDGRHRQGDRAHAQALQHAGPDDFVHLHI
jgi:hypothetical protein